MRYCILRTHHFLTSECAKPTHTPFHHHRGLNSTTLSPNHLPDHLVARTCSTGCLASVGTNLTILGSRERNIHGTRLELHCYRITQMRGRTKSHSKKYHNSQRSPHFSWTTNIVRRVHSSASARPCSFIRVCDRATTASRSITALLCPPYLLSLYGEIKSLTASRYARVP